MHFLNSFVILLAAGAAQAASWGFDEATLTIGSKKTEGGVKEKFTDKTLPKSPFTFGSSDTLKIMLTTKEGGKAKQPHQGFLVLEDQESGLEAPFPLIMKETGKATVDIKHADIPTPLLASSVPLHARLMIASFGSSRGYNTPILDIIVKLDPLATRPTSEKPMRYGKRDEIRHIYRDDPKSPPKIISLIFVLAVVATAPILVACWAFYGANLSHLQKALSSAPLSHGAFVGSIISMEFLFFLYYTNWTLFEVLPLMSIVGVTTVLSGSKALGEVQSRRLAGER